MTHIRYVELKDKDSWMKLDSHLSESEFTHKVQLKTGYVITIDEIVVGILRYNLFWDQIPFCTMLSIDSSYQHKGYGSMLLKHWEKDMKSKHYDMVLTSTQVDESAQHFYRKLGYKDCGGMTIDIPKYAQPMELFLIKEI